MSAVTLLGRLGRGLAVTATAAAVARILLRSLPVPPDSETVEVEGLQAPVEVAIDPWGIPHVDAGSVADAYLAQGYLHARDRFWQMDLNRRVARGQVSELLGPRALDIDRLMRRMRFSDAARRNVNHLARDDYAVIEAYTGGVNAYLGGHRRPLEHMVLLARPQPWTVIDTLALACFMSWAQSPGWAGQLVRMRLRAASEAAATFETERHDAASFPVPAVLGSNAWAVSKDRSASGRTLLASDPHVAPQLPPLWYLTHLRAPGLNVAGAGVPGLPGIVIGHNERIAWGVANVPAATEDLVLERPENVRTRNEIIHVRWCGAVDEALPFTENGPVLNGTLGIPPNDRPIALKTVLAGAPGPLSAVLAMGRAGDWRSFISALKRLELPCMSFVYADIDGNIGYKLAGRILLRRIGDGRLPQDADEDPLWNGTVPYEELPELLNPPSGFVAAANNRPPMLDGPPIGADWADDTRYRRISDLLAAKPTHTLEDMARIQTDICSVGASEVLRRLRSRPPYVLNNQAGRRLVAWDSAMRPDSVTASLYAAFRIALVRRTHPELTARELGYLEGRGPHPDLVPTSLFYFRATSNLLWWMDRASDDTVRAALDDAAAWLRVEHRSLERCRWGRLHQVRFSHALGRGSRLIDRALGLSRGPFPLGGDADTVAQAGVDPANPFAAGGFCVSYRQLIDVGDWDRSLVVLPGGQSGHAGSRHYASQLRDFRRGHYVPLLFSAGRIRGATTSTIRLVPRAPKSVGVR